MEQDKKVGCTVVLWAELWKKACYLAETSIEGAAANQRLKGEDLPNPGLLLACR